MKVNALINSIFTRGQRHQQISFVENEKLLSGKVSRQRMLKKPQDIQ